MTQHIFVEGMTDGAHFTVHCEGESFLPRIFEAKLAAHAATATIATGADFDRMKVHPEEEEEIWDGPRHRRWFLFNKCCRARYILGVDELSSR